MFPETSRPRQEMGRRANDSAYVYTWRGINRQIKVSPGRYDSGSAVLLPPLASEGDYTHMCIIKVDLGVSCDASSDY